MEQLLREVRARLLSALTHVMLIAQGIRMSTDLNFNAALLGAAAAWIKKAPGQDSTGPSTDSAAAPTTDGHAKKGGAKQRAGLGHVVKRKEDATKVRETECCLYASD